MIDLSDGLSSDLSRLCAASNVGARIRQTAIPGPGKTFAKNFEPEEMRQAILHGGDDYELLFTVAPARIRGVPKDIAGVPVTEIGEMTGGHHLEIVKPGGRTISFEPHGWDPFER